MQCTHGLAAACCAVLQYNVTDGLIGASLPPLSSQQGVFEQLSSSNLPPQSAKSVTLGPMRRDGRRRVTVQVTRPSYLIHDPAVAKANSSAAPWEQHLKGQSMLVPLGPYDQRRLDDLFDVRNSHMLGRELPNAYYIDLHRQPRREAAAFASRVLDLMELMRPLMPTGCMCGFIVGQGIHSQQPRRGPNAAPAVPDAILRMLDLEQVPVGSPTTNPGLLVVACNCNPEQFMVPGAVWEAPSLIWPPRPQQQQHQQRAMHTPPPPRTADAGFAWHGHGGGGAAYFSAGAVPYNGYNRGSSSASGGWNGGGAGGAGGRGARGWSAGPGHRGWHEGGRSRGRREDAEPMGGGAGHQPRRLAFDYARSDGDRAPERGAKRSPALADDGAGCCGWERLQCGSPPRRSHSSGRLERQRHRSRSRKHGQGRRRSISSDDTGRRSASPSDEDDAEQQAAAYPALAAAVQGTAGARGTRYMECIAPFRAVSSMCEDALSAHPCGPLHTGDPAAMYLATHPEYVALRYNSLEETKAQLTESKELPSFASIRRIPASEGVQEQWELQGLELLDLLDPTKEKITVRSYSQRAAREHACWRLLAAVLDKEHLEKETKIANPNKRAIWFSFLSNLKR